MSFKEITVEEKERCKKVVAAFNELYFMYDDMLIADAGKNGFVHLKWYDGENFLVCDIFTDSRALFESLWEYWKEYQLLKPVLGTKLVDLTYEELYVQLRPEERTAMEKKRMEFWKTAFGERDMF